jgi:hypothetical protein
MYYNEWDVYMHVRPDRLDVYAGGGAIVPFGVAPACGALPSVVPRPEPFPAPPKIP